jgi:hypothetical protein
MGAFFRDGLKMKWVVEFSRHDGVRVRTLPVTNEQSAKYMALAVVITLAPYSDHDPAPEVLAVPEALDLGVPDGN